MTISSQTSEASYSGNDVTTAFSVPFKFNANADITAVLATAAGVETTLTNPTHYSLTGAGDANGGTLTMVTAPATTETLIIYRAPAIVQEVDYVENSAFPAETHEGALDLLTMICQRLGKRIDRAVTIPISSSVTPTDYLTTVEGYKNSAAASAATATTKADEASASATAIASGAQTVTNLTCTGGTINGTTVGATTPAAGKFTLVNIDNIQIDGNTIEATTGALNLTPKTGSAIVLDGTINVDAGVVTGATSITSTAFAGNLNGIVGGSTPAAVTGTVVTAGTRLITTEINTNAASNLQVKTSGGNAGLFMHVASPVNQLMFGSAATGQPASIQSSESGAGIAIISNNGNLNLATAAGNTPLAIGHTASMVNNFALVGGITNFAPTLFVEGADTDVHLALTAKGAGTVRTANPVVLNANTTILPAPPTSAGQNYLQLGAADATVPRILLDAFASQGQLAFRRANTTNAAPTAVVAANILGTISAFGYGATGYSSSARANLSFSATETWTDTAQGTSFAVSTTPTGGTTPTGRISVDGSGTVTLCGTTPALVASVVTSAVNCFAFRGAITGSPAEAFANGADTDIDLLFSPKGAGTVRFGTYSAKAAEVHTGYITIKDAGGTPRKVMICA